MKLIFKVQQLENVFEKNHIPLWKNPEYQWIQAIYSTSGRAFTCIIEPASQLRMRNWAWCSWDNRKPVMSFSCCYYLTITQTFSWFTKRVKEEKYRVESINHIVFVHQYTSCLHGKFPRLDSKLKMRVWRHGSMVESSCWFPAPTCYLRIACEANFMVSSAPFWFL